MKPVEHLIEIALDEDIGSGDITTDNLVEPDVVGNGLIIAKEDFLLAGINVAGRVFQYLDSKAVFKPFYKDGNTVRNGKTVAEVTGKLRALLKGERTALNFLQRLSGIATSVQTYVNMIENKKVRLVDTRKTLPGWRILDKYAVRVGGAFNHRTGLFDGVLIKDNHIAVCGGIPKAVENIRKNVHHLVKIEVEVSDMDQVRQALDAHVDVIMLDNMDIEQIKDALSLIDKRAIVEVSGGITKKKLKQLADTGVDIISSGALTHSVKSVDISMNIQTVT